MKCALPPHSKCIFIYLSSNSVCQTLWAASLSVEVIPSGPLNFSIDHGISESSFSRLSMEPIEKWKNPWTQNDQNLTKSRILQLNIEQDRIKKNNQSE